MGRNIEQRDAWNCARKACGKLFHQKVYQTNSGINFCSKACFQRVMDANDGDEEVPFIEQLANMKMPTLHVRPPMWMRVWIYVRSWMY